MEQLLFVISLIALVIVNICKSYNHFHYLKVLDKGISRYDNYLEFSMWSYDIPLKLRLFFPYLAVKEVGQNKYAKAYLSKARTYNWVQLSLMVFIILLLIIF